MKLFYIGHISLKLPMAKQLLATINKNFSTLTFCRWYLDERKEEKEGEKEGDREEEGKRSFKKFNFLDF